MYMFVYTQYTHAEVALHCVFWMCKTMYAHAHNTFKGCTFNTLSDLPDPFSLGVERGVETGVDTITKQDAAITFTAMTL